MTSSHTDAELVARTLAGHKDAYRVLVERYQDRVFALANEMLKNREDAEDIAQESFVKAYLSLSDFKGQSSFYTWLYRIVYNMVIDYRRKVARRGGPGVELDESVSEDSAGLMGRIEGPHENLVRREQNAQIQEALDKMSEEHRAIIMLREVDGLSYEEIAKVTGVSRGTVMSRLHYARKRLQDVLSQAAKRDDIERGGPKGSNKPLVREEPKDEISFDENFNPLKPKLLRLMLC